MLNPDQTTTTAAAAAKPLNRWRRWAGTGRASSVMRWDSAGSQRGQVLHRALFREILGPEDLPDLDGVAFVRRAALRPLHNVFPGRRFHQPVAAQHVFCFDRRSVGHGGLAVGERYARTLGRRMQAVERFNLERLAHFFVEPSHLFHLLRIRLEARRRLATLVNSGNHQHHEFHGDLLLAHQGGGSCDSILPSPRFTSLHGPRRQIASAAARPSISGINTSMRTASYGCCATEATASRPLDTTSTVWPS